MFLPADWLLSHKNVNLWGGVGWGGGDDTTHASCSATWPSLAFLHERAAPLLDLHLHFYMNSWCFAAWFALACLHELDAPLLDLHLHFCKNLLLRCLVFICISTWTLDASLLDLHLHFYMNLMLRCLIFTCISTWTWCSAAWSSLAFLHELDAPLLDLHLHFYMNSWCSAAWSSLACLHELLMLRCLIFTCISTWTWCSAAWSSLAFLHELLMLDSAAWSSLAFLHELLMLRCLIFICISTWTLDAPLLDLHLHVYMNSWCSAAWSSLAFLHELDAPLLGLHLHFYMNSWCWTPLLDLHLHFYMNSWCSAAWSSLTFHTGNVDGVWKLAKSKAQPHPQTPKVKREPSLRIGEIKNPRAAALMSPDQFVQRKSGSFPGALKSLLSSSAMALQPGHAALEKVLNRETPWRQLVNWKPAITEKILAVAYIFRFGRITTSSASIAITGPLKELHCLRRREVLAIDDFGLHRQGPSSEYSIGFSQKLLCHLNSKDSGGWRAHWPRVPSGWIPGNFGRVVDSQSCIAGDCGGNVP